MRAFLAVMTGMLIAVTLVSITDLVAGRMHPAPLGFDYMDPAQVHAHIATMPANAWLVMLAGWLGATLAGGSVAARVAPSRPDYYAWIVAGIFFAATMTNVVRIQHPTWMIGAAVFGIPMMGWLAARLAPKTPSK